MKRNHNGERVLDRKAYARWIVTLSLSGLVSLGSLVWGLSQQLRAKDIKGLTEDCEQLKQTQTNMAPKVQQNTQDIAALKAGLDERLKNMEQMLEKIQTKMGIWDPQKGGGQTK